MRTDCSNSWRAHKLQYYTLEGNVITPNISAPYKSKFAITGCASPLLSDATKTLGNIEWENENSNRVNGKDATNKA